MSTACPWQEDVSRSRPQHQAQLPIAAPRMHCLRGSWAQPSQASLRQRSTVLAREEELQTWLQQTRASQRLRPSHSVPDVRSPVDL